MLILRKLDLVPFTVLRGKDNHAAVGRVTRNYKHQIAQEGDQEGMKAVEHVQEANARQT